MKAPNDLPTLLRTMRPVLGDTEMGYGLIRNGQGIPDGVSPFATVAEAEGLTVIAPARVLAECGIDHVAGWARISLTVHSDLAAVGLTAAIAAALTAEAISANVVAGYFHDHVFVQWDRRHDAMAALARLSAT